MFGIEIFLFRFGLSITINGLGVTIAALKKHLKFPSGALAALFVGVSLLTFSIFAWLLLLTFFVSSSLLTKFRASMKIDVQEKFEIDSVVM